MNVIKYYDRNNPFQIKIVKIRAELHAACAQSTKYFLFLVLTCHYICIRIFLGLVSDRSFSCFSAAVFGIESGLENSKIFSSPKLVGQRKKQGM